MKFILFVEGETEQKVLPDLMRPWLNARLRERVGLKIVRFEGWRDYYDEIRVKTHLWLDGPQAADVIGGFGLLDLYGPTLYPAHLILADQRYAWFKSHIEKKVDHRKFRQHFAIHELEAWLLAVPGNLPHAVSKALPGKAGRPETVNFDEPPAKLLSRLYREKEKRRFKKTTDTVNLFQRLSPEKVYESCPSFRALLDDMLIMARECLSEVGTGSG